jgi:hypothetical protein
MLPDFRVVIIAVVSTFLLTVSVGFYTSSRLLNEPRKSRSESLASHEDSPISRIALNWPEPVQQTAQLDLDFAVTLNGSRNPVRDITTETIETQAELKAPASAPQTTTRDVVATNQASPENETDTEPARAETNESEGLTLESALRSEKIAEPVPAKEPASIQAARDILSPTPALEIESSTAGLRLVTQGAEAIVASPGPQTEETTTALMTPTPKADAQAMQPDRQQAEEQIAEPEKPQATADIHSDNPSDPDQTGTITVKDESVPMPQARPDRAAAAKKAIIVTKRTKRNAKPIQKRFRARLRRPPPAPSATLFFPFNLFVQPNQTNQPAQLGQPNQTNQFNQPTPTVQTR